MFPQNTSFSDEPIMLVKEDHIIACGKKSYNLQKQDPSTKLYKPFENFLAEQDNFDVAEKIIHCFIKEKILQKNIIIMPRVIIHPDTNKLNEMEEAFYKEVALAAGAREVKVHLGEKLKANDIKEYDFLS